MTTLLKRFRQISISVGLLLSLATAADSLAGSQGRRSNDKTTHAWCGTHHQGHVVAEALHRFQLRRQRRADGASGGKLHGAPTVTRAGDVAVIEDDGTIVVEPNRLDLARHGINFRRRKDSLRATIRSPVPIKANLGSPVDINDDDSVFVEFPPGFEFPFFGIDYDGVFVNSDGNLTFTQPDNTSDARSLARVLNGPPRVAPLFVDLDPSKAIGTAGVYSKLTASRLQITWSRVPEFGKTNENTVQVTLFKSGRILIAYGELGAQDAVVGVAPGGGGELELLDYTADLPAATATAALIERFSNSEQVDDQAIAQTFFRRFADVYDHLIVWLDFDVDLEGAFAFELTVRNRVRGIGVDLYDSSAGYGSDGRLESYVQMGGPLIKYSLDPERDILRTNTTWEVLGHEVGHRWLAFVRFRDADGNDSEELLRGSGDLGHWSFFLDSDASLLGGNNLRDNGDGSFTTTAATERYSRLDRYLMGLIPARRVGNFFLVTEASDFIAADTPELDATFDGTRVNLGVDDIITAVGERIPNNTKAPKRFRMAFILVGRKGEPPSQTAIDKVDRIRRLWRPYFRAASGSARVSTVLIDRS